MGSTMLSSRYEASYRVCEVLELSCDREDSLTEVVVTKIVELAQAGERDPEILCSKLLAELGTPTRGVTLPEASTSGAIAAEAA
jgi:hypothetical protein